MCAVGIPSEFIRAIQAFYKNNTHSIKLRAGLYPGPTVFCGVRQGCPLSGLLFAICADVLLVRLKTVLSYQDEVARAFADDTAAVVHDWIVSIPTLAKLFDDYADISNLQLNIAKTVFVPLWRLCNKLTLSNLIREICPQLRMVKVDNNSKYLGFMIGPGRDVESWTAPLAKFEKRVAEWESVHAGIFWNSIYYNTFIVTTLEFVAQLEELPTLTIEAEEAAMRKLARGPGNWISMVDLENLGKLGVGAGFRLLAATAGAAKLRVLQELGRNRISKMCNELEEIQSNFLARPFGQWHYQSFVSILCTNERGFRAAGVTIRQIKQSLGKHCKAEFQKLARQRFSVQMLQYDVEERVRRKIARWKLQGPPAHIAKRCVRLLELLRQSARPAVCSGYLRALWNGWPTSARMRSMPNAGPVLPCVLKCCPEAEDRIEHYARCPIVWKFLSTPAPSGPGAPLAHKGLDGFFALHKGTPECMQLRVAAGVHAVGKIIMFARQGQILQEDVDKALLLEWRKNK